MLRFSGRCLRAAMGPSVQEIQVALTALGVSIEDVADAKAFKKRYLECVRRHHPDTGGDPEKMKAITSAYELLQGLSHTERRAYAEYSTRPTSSSSSSSTMGNRWGSSDGATYGYHRSPPPHDTYTHPSSHDPFYSADAAYDWRSYYQQQRARTQNSAGGNPYTSTWSSSYGQPGASFTDAYSFSSFSSSTTQRPFASVHSAPFRNPMDRLRFGFYHILLRALLAYFVVSMTLAMLFRIWRQLRSTAGEAGESTSATAGVETSTLSTGWASDVERREERMATRELYRKRMEELEMQRRRYEAERAAALGRIPSSSNPSSSISSAQQDTFDFTAASTKERVQGGNEWSSGGALHLPGVVYFDPKNAKEL